MDSEKAVVIFSTKFLSRAPLNNEDVKELAFWGRKLVDLEAVRQTEGNISHRSRDGFIISGTNVALTDLDGRNVTEITGVVYGSPNSVMAKGLVVPSSESLLHAAIYDLCEGINAIFHAHDPIVMKKAREMQIPETKAERPPGSAELAAEAVKLLKQNSRVRYFVLKNHGVVALGGDVDEAGRLCEEMHRRAYS